VSEENVRIVRESQEAFAAGGLEAALSYSAPDIVSTRVDPDRAEYHGHEGLVRMIAEWEEDFTELTYAPDDFVDAGDQVIARLHQSARGARSGVPVEADFWLVWDLEAGRITRMAIYTERDQAFAAAGLG
jgi:ketosteroid isomerase-like protein